MPSYSDEQFDDVADTRASRRRRVIQQPRNLPEREEHPREDFYTDEHPEIPKIRRASLYLDPQTSSSHRPATKASGVETEHARRGQSPQRRKKQYEEQYEYDETYESYAEPPRKNAVSQRRRPVASPSSVQSPPKLPRPSYASRSRSANRVPTKTRLQQRHKRQVLSPFTFLPQFVQRQNLPTIGGFVIALLLILVVVSSLFHMFFSQVPGFIVIPGMTNDTDPHHLVITPVNTDHPSPPVYAQGAYLLDADTGNTLYAQNPFMHLPIMSTTKLMTALLTVEHGNLDQMVTINGQIANDIKQLPPDSSNVNLKAGESYTLRQLMYGLLLASGNDAAIAIGDTVGGSFAKFVAMMNQKAADLGLHDTHFENPNGLQQPNHYSCAHDMAIIGLHSLTDATVRQISGTLNYHIDQTAQHAAHDFFNGNQFIWWYPGVDAGKPGYDAATNFVQVISCVRNNRHLIGVTIHTIDWWTDMRDLMNWGFNTYTWLSPHDLNTPTHPIPYAGLWNNFAGDKKENTIPTADHGRYYVYTGYSITGDFESFYDKNGGFASFGFPTSAPGDAGDNTVSQHFEHGSIQCNTQSKQCQKGT